MRSAGLLPGITLAALAIPASVIGLKAPAQRLDLERTRSGQLAVEVSLGGQVVTAVLDTGATITMVSAAVATRARLTPRARSSVVDTIGHTRPLLVSGPVELRWGSVAVRLAGVAWTPCVAHPPGADGLEAVLGADSLSEVDLLIDPSRSSLWVAASGTLSDWVDGDEVPLKTPDGRPTVEVELAGVGETLHLPFVIDSGADAPVVFGERATALARDGAGATAALVTAGGTSRVRTARLGRALVGNHSLRLGRSVLLPGITGRDEAGLLPLESLTPILLELASSRARLAARLRSTPRVEATSTLARANP